MNKVNRKVEYALMALKHMSQKFAGQLTSAKEISDQIGSPFDATSRVMQLMAQKGILKSEHGAHGGYLIVKDLSKVTFYDVITTVLAPIEVVKCVSGQETCDLFSKCNVQSPLQTFNNKLVDFYQTLPVSELLQIPLAPKGEKTWQIQP